MRELIISLTDITVKAPVGFYEGERKLKRDFLVDVKVQLQQVTGAVKDIDQTVNYEILLKIVQEEMAKEAQLIEEVAQRISASVKKKFTKVSAVKVKITKPNPFMHGKAGAAEVEWRESTELEVRSTK